MAGQIKAVLFYLDNTLADCVSAFRSLITALWHDEPKIQQFSSVEETVAAFELWDADGLTFPKRKIFERAVSRWGKLSRGPKELESWYYASYASHFEPDKRVNAKLDTLDESGIPWAVITNGPPFQADVARAIGIYGRGSGIVISSMFGASKPSPAIFNEGLRLVGSPEPSECLFVGDSPTADIKGAMSIGMRTAWVRRGRKWPYDLPHPILMVNHVCELITVIDL